MESVRYEIDEVCTKLEQVKFLLGEINETTGNKVSCEGVQKVYELQTRNDLTNMFVNIAVDILVQACTRLEQVT